MKINARVMRVDGILPSPIAPHAQELLQDEEGDKAGKQQPGKLTPSPDPFHRLRQQVTERRAQERSSGQAYQEWNNPGEALSAD